MEIEVKAKVENKEQLLKKLTEIGCVFSEPKIQDDTVFVKDSKDLEKFLSNEFFLRIRVENNSKAILTVKKPKEKTGLKSLVKHEFEVTVDSEEQVRGMINLLGLEEAVRVVKNRIFSHYKDFEICVDEIVDLGTFIEIEKIAGENDSDKIQREMLVFLETLGIKDEDVIKKGYDILMLEKKATK